jgi:oligopeptide transport system substrate-binding protein
MRLACLVRAAVTWALLMATICAPPCAALAAGSGDDASSRILRRGNGAEPETLDPHRATGMPEAMIFYDLYEGLLSRDADGVPQPAIAESWQTAEDGLSVTFRLRSGLRWSDGAPLTADDVVFSFRRLVDPASGSHNGNHVWPVRNARAITAGRIRDPTVLGVKALDPLTVRFELEAPTPYFVASLGYPMLAVLPQAPMQALGKDFFKPGHLVSNGAYKLEEAVPQSHVKLVRNPFYRQNNQTVLDAIYFYPTENQDTELKRFRAGELDVTFVLPPTQTAWARKNLPLDFRQVPELGIYALLANLGKEPWASKPSLVEALSMVIDRAALTERITQAGESPSLSYVPASVSAYHPATPVWAAWPMERRVEHARHLLAEAGYPEGKGLEVDLRFNTAENQRRIAVAVASMWQSALGMKAVLTNQEWKVFIEGRRIKTFPGFARGGLIGAYDDPNAFLEFFRSDMGPENPTGYASPAFDALMERSTREHDPKKRMEILREAEALLLREAGVIPLFVYSRARLVSQRLEGWRANAVNANASRFLRLKEP